MAKPLIPNFGQIGFESCSILINFGSMMWLLLGYIVSILILLPFNKWVINNLLSKDIGKVIKSMRRTLLYNDVILQLDSI